jgi:metallo-beta-lactamase class B
VLKAPPVDLILGVHGSYYGMATKHARFGASTENPFVDPEGYHRYVADREQAFRAKWERQKAK